MKENCFLVTMKHFKKGPCCVTIILQCCCCCNNKKIKLKTTLNPSSQLKNNIIPCRKACFQLVLSCSLKYFDKETPSANQQNKQTDVLNRAFNFSLVFILELVLVAHHQVRVGHTQLEGVKLGEIMH